MGLEKCFGLSHGTSRLPPLRLRWGEVPTQDEPQFVLGPGIPGNDGGRGLGAGYKVCVVSCPNKVVVLRCTSLYCHSCALSVLVVFGINVVLLGKLVTKD